MSTQQAPQFQLTAVPHPELSRLAGRGGSVARFKAITGFPHSRTTTVVLGKPVSTDVASLADGSTIAKLTHTLDQLIHVPQCQRHQPVPKVQVVLCAEESDYAGRGVEVLVDFTGDTPQLELVFDQMLDCSDTRAWTLAAFDAAAAKLCADNAAGLCAEPGAQRTGASPDDRDGNARPAPGPLPA